MKIEVMTDEQAAFNPANIVPGIGFSPDKMLQGRLFSYGEWQEQSDFREPALGLNRNILKTVC